MVTRGKSKALLAYTAGLFDGEGYITILRAGIHKSLINPTHILAVGMSLTDKPTIERLKEQFGGSVVLDPRIYPNRRQVFMWRMSGPSAVDFLRGVYPFLRIKHPQADIAFRFQVLKSKRWGRGKIHPDNMRQRNDLCEQIRALNASRFPHPQRLSEETPAIAG